MKILTNIQTSNLGGIGQTFKNLVDYASKYEKTSINFVGVRITGDHNSDENNLYKESQKQSNLKLISVNLTYPNFSDIIDTSTSVDHIKNAYQSLTDVFKKIIKDESPDLVLLNGTYIVPWCLFLAASSSNIPIVLHYHGILTKELSNYPKDKLSLVTDMEKVFDNDRLLYLFPSDIARKTVENEVFGHQIFKTAVLPNPIPGHFFEINSTGKAKNVGFVGRWSDIKNPRFVESLATYNHQKGDDFKINIVTDPKKAKKRTPKHIKNKVNFIKPMDNSKLANFYASQGSIISPSFFETYGNVAQEAIASGTPALISLDMGVSETYQKFGLQDWIIDFKSASHVYKILKEVSGQPVNPIIREKMRNYLSSQSINQKLVSLLRSS